MPDVTSLFSRLVQLQSVCCFGAFFRMTCTVKVNWSADWRNGSKEERKKKMSERIKETKKEWLKEREKEEFVMPVSRRDLVNHRY